MAVLFKFRSLFRSLFPGVQLPEKEVEVRENAPAQTRAEALAAREECRREAKRRKRRRQAERKRAARLAAGEPQPVVATPPREPVYGSDLMLQQARELLALGFLPSAAVCCWIAFEGHLRQLCEAKDIHIGRSPRLADIVDLLTLHGYYDSNEKSIVCQHLKVANGAAHGCAAEWWEVASLIAFVACTITTLGLPAGWEGGAA